MPVGFFYAYLYGHVVVIRRFEPKKLVPAKVKFLCLCGKDVLLFVFFLCIMLLVKKLYPFFNHPSFFNRYLLLTTFIESAALISSQYTGSVGRITIPSFFPPFG